LAANRVDPLAQALGDSAAAVVVDGSPSRRVGAEEQLPRALFELGDQPSHPEFVGVLRVDGVEEALRLADGDGPGGDLVAVAVSFHHDAPLGLVDLQEEEIRRHGELDLGERLARYERDE